ncbi:MAG TPA: hypothetical protein VID48_05195 [Solirubrobacteraceae bacterium]|jgi:hypothetical protein
MGETCPLCASALSAEQDWCLRCGGAARTRLAPSPNWRAPILGLALAIVLAAGVLTAALVKMADKSGGASPTRTVTTFTTQSSPITPSSAIATPTVTNSAGAIPTATTPAAPSTQGASGALSVPRAVVPATGAGTPRASSSTSKP